VTQDVKVSLIALVSTALVGAAPTASSSDTQTYVVPLTGKAVTNFAHPTGGTADHSGSGSVTLTIDPEAKLVCYRFSISVDSEPIMAHIHARPLVHVGAPLVTLFTGTGSKLDDYAASTHSQLAEINANPSDYYVSVDTTAYPDGALRGQL
jgi:CHRD domain